METTTHEIEKALQEKDAALATLTKQVASLEAKLSHATSQLDWFKRQLFGRKSEKLIEPNPNQDDLFKSLLKQSQACAASTEKTVTVAQHERKKQPVKEVA